MLRIPFGVRWSKYSWYAWTVYRFASVRPNAWAEFALSVSVKPMWIWSYFVLRAASIERPSPVTVCTRGSVYGDPDHRPRSLSTTCTMSLLSSITSTRWAPEVSALSMSRPPPPPMISTRRGSVIA